MGAGMMGKFQNHTYPSETEQDPVFLAPPTIFLACLLSVKYLGQSISLIREMTMWESKGKQSKETK